METWVRFTIGRSIENERDQGFSNVWSRDHCLLRCEGDTRQADLMDLQHRRPQTLEPYLSGDATWKAGTPGSCRKGYRDASS